MKCAKSGANPGIAIKTGLQPRNLYAELLLCHNYVTCSELYIHVYVIVLFLEFYNTVFMKHFYCLS